jgi:hypothetical protein
MHFAIQRRMNEWNAELHACDRQGAHCRTVEHGHRVSESPALLPHTDVCVRALVVDAICVPRTVAITLSCAHVRTVRSCLPCVVLSNDAVIPRGCHALLLTLHDCMMRAHMHPPKTSLGARRAKELHFFDESTGVGVESKAQRYDRGLDFYHSHFDPFPPPSGSRLVDCTPTYLASVAARRRVAETYAGSRDTAKFVVVMRDPVERAVSHWTHAWTMSRKHRKFGRLGHWTIKLVSAPARHHPHIPVQPMAKGAQKHK